MARSCLKALLLGTAARGLAAAADKKCYYMDEVFPSEAIEVDIESYLDGHGGRSRMDVYTAKGDTRGKRPAVILIHGGTYTGGNTTSSCTWPDDWITGLKEDAKTGQDTMRECTALPKFARKLAQHGYVVFSIDYYISLTSKWEWAKWLAALTARHNTAGVDAAMDARAAVRWIKKNAAAFRVDPDKIAMQGDSAGAITTMWSNYRVAEVDGDKTFDTSADVAVAISLSGMMSYKFLAPFLPDFTGSICCKDAQPPLLVIHSEGDSVIPYSAGKELHDQAQSVGLATEMISIPKSWHIPYTELMDADPKQTQFYFATYNQFLVDQMGLDLDCHSLAFV